MAAILKDIVDPAPVSELYIKNKISNPQHNYAIFFWFSDLNELLALYTLTPSLAGNTYY